MTRRLCPYPDPDAIYTGGNPNVAASYTCRSQPRFTNPFHPFHPFQLKGRRAPLG